MPEAPLPVDVPAALARLSVDGEAARMLFNLFLEETARLIAMLRQAAQGGDTRLLVRTAHTIKGSAAMMGAEALHAVAAQIEELGQTEDRGALSALLNQVQSTFDAVRLFLAEETFAGYQ
jgi:HPt (histidine-containing phosphotransfer) domain-containing protein